MNTIFSKVASYLVSQWWNSLRDHTAYNSSTKNDIDDAVSMFDNGEYEYSLKMLSAIAHLVDCKAFHKYGFFGAYHINNVEAREQFNRLCLYIARIYNIKEDYSNVLFWANKLAYVPSISIAEWLPLLNPQDFEELSEYFTNCDIDREATSDVWHEYLTRPCN